MSTISAVTSLMSTHYTQGVIETTHSVTLSGTTEPLFSAPMYIVAGVLMALAAVSVLWKGLHFLNLGIFLVVGMVFFALPLGKMFLIDVSWSEAIPSTNTLNAEPLRDDISQKLSVDVSDLAVEGAVQDSMDKEGDPVTLPVGDGESRMVLSISAVGDTSESDSILVTWDATAG